MSVEGAKPDPVVSGSALLEFIARPEERHFDPMYALRLCSQHGRSLAMVHLYSAMELWEEAVDLALTGECGMESSRRGLCGNFVRGRGEVIILAAAFF